MTSPADKLTRLDNHRVFRAEAVTAYTTRRAGDAWIPKMRGERWIVCVLTILGAAALIFLKLGGR